MANRIIKWDNEALAAFKAAMLYIRKRSYQNAEKVSAEIISRIDKLAEHPEFWSPDKWKLNNEGEFRAFELHRFRVSYQVKETEIVIVRFRHTSQQPEDY